MADPVKTIGSSVGLVLTVTLTIIKHVEAAKRAENCVKALEGPLLILRKILEDMQEKYPNPSPHSALGLSLQDIADTLTEVRVVFENVAERSRDEGIFAFLKKVGFGPKDAEAIDKASFDLTTHLHFLNSAMLNQVNTTLQENQNLLVEMNSSMKKRYQSRRQLGGLAPKQADQKPDEKYLQYIQNEEARKFWEQTVGALRQATDLAFFSSAVRSEYKLKPKQAKQLLTVLTEGGEYILVTDWNCLTNEKVLPDCLVELPSPEELKEIPCRAGYRCASRMNKCPFEHLREEEEVEEYDPSKSAPQLRKIENPEEPVKHTPVTRSASLPKRGLTRKTAKITVASEEVMDDLKKKKIEETKFSNLIVTVRAGKKLGSRDPNGLSDPLVIVEVGDKKRKTDHIPKTLNPEWNRTFDISGDFDCTTILFLECWDHNTFLPNDLIGKVEIPLAPLQEGPIDDWFELEPDREEYPDEEITGFISLYISKD